MTCPHHWLIEEPSGVKSEGVCRHCGLKESVYAPTSALQARVEGLLRYLATEELSGRRGRANPPAAPLL